ncbi:MAG: hypothetical protein U0361_19850 [Nitrospiraceae bacterium]
MTLPTNGLSALAARAGFGLAGGGLSGRARAEAASAATGPLITRVTRPFDAETPVQELLLGSRRMNDCSFAAISARLIRRRLIRRATWRLTVEGRVETPLTLTLTTRIEARL